jgi:hypothetical protein
MATSGDPLQGLLRMRGGPVRKAAALCRSRRVASWSPPADRSARTERFRRRYAIIAANGWARARRTSRAAALTLSAATCSVDKIAPPPPNPIAANHGRLR